MSIINDKERVEATNQISAIDIQESSGLLKDHISTSWLSWLPDAVQRLLPRGRRTQIE